MKSKGMEYMKGYSQGYKPPSGSAGKEAHGDYSHRRNPMSVPRKGSSIPDESEFGRNGDREKAERLQKEQAKKESLRGYGC